MNHFLHKLLLVLELITAIETLSGTMWLLNFQNLEINNSYKVRKLLKILPHLVLRITVTCNSVCVLSIMQKTGVAY